MPVPVPDSGVSGSSSPELAEGLPAAGRLQTPADPSSDSERRDDERTPMVTREGNDAEPEVAESVPDQPTRAAVLTAAGAMMRRSRVASAGSTGSVSQSWPSPAANFVALDENRRRRQNDLHERARKGHIVHNCPPEEWLAGVHCVSEDHRTRIDMATLIQPFAKPRKLPSEWTRPGEISIREFPLYSMPCFELEEPSLCTCEGLRKFITWQINGILFNRRNKDLYLQLESRIGALRKRLDGMHDQLYHVTQNPEVTIIAGKDADMDHLVLKSQKTLIEAGQKKSNWKLLAHGIKGHAVVAGDKASQMDEAAESVLPGFLSRFLGELIVTYQELDMILMDKRKVDPGALFDYDKEWNPKRLQFVKTSTCACCSCRACCGSGEQVESRREKRRRLRREGTTTRTALAQIC